MKAFLREADEVLEREFKRVLAGIEAAEAAQANAWGASLDGDGFLAKADIEDYLASAKGIVRASNDDKCKVPNGEPGYPIGANVRAMAASLVLKCERLLAMDHLWHRASTTPTVTLLTDLRHAFETNKWRNGQIVVSLKDSVLEPSSAFRNAAELATAILAHCPKPIIIDKRTDGGSEQNTEFGSVQLADISLWKKTGADVLIHQRPAADQSALNDVEGCMPLLNLGMQHQSSERLKMDPKYETLLANEGSMSAIREKIASIENESEREAAVAAWVASLHGPGGPIEQFEQRFSRLQYTDRTVKIQQAATADEIAAMHALVKEIDSAWEPGMTTKAVLLKLEKLQRFLDSHTTRDKYIVCVFKCGDVDCEFGCQRLRMPRAAFATLIHDRLKAKCKIVPLPEHTGASGKDHFAKYNALKDRPTSAKDMPSFKPPTEASAAAKKADVATAKAVATAAKAAHVDLFTSKKARLTITCSECGVPRVLYSLARLSSEEEDLAQSVIDDVSSYVCGTTDLFPEGHALASKLFLKSASACGMPVERTYYTSKQFRDCCSWCGVSDPLELQDLLSLNLNGSKAYSICKHCYASGKKVITFGKANKTGAKKKKAKGAKTRKAKGAGAKRPKKAVPIDSSDEEEDEEDSSDEEEEEEESEDEEGEEGEDEEEEEEDNDDDDDDEYMYKVELVIAKREFVEARKGRVTKWAVKWEGHDTTAEMTWEPAANLQNVRELINAFERRLASIPAIGAFTGGASGASACCYGAVCRRASDADLVKNPCQVCAKELHHSCSSEHPFLEPFYDKLESDNYCFDCALLLALVERRTPFGLTGGQLMFEPYYMQLRGVASLVSPSPFSLGALLATGSLKLVDSATIAARPLPSPAKCVVCKSAEGDLRACSFCKSGIYHDTAACLGEERPSSASLTHASFPWCCPKCFKKGVAALEQKLLRPPQAAKKRK